MNVCNKLYLHQASCDVSARFGVTSNIRFGERISCNTWDADTNTWRVETEAGLQLRANIIVSGSGALHVPKLPQFPGMDTFKGDAFHTALWKKDYEPKGKKVAVIGTGASAVQVSMIITMILRDLIVTVNFTSRWQCQAKRFFFI